MSLTILESLLAHSTYFIALRPVHQLSVFNVRRCGRFVARFLLKSSTVPQHRLACLPVLRMMQSISGRGHRQDLTERYVRCNTPSRLLGWR